MEENQCPNIPVQSSTQMIFRYFLIIFLITIFFVGKVLWPFLSILVLAFVLTGIFYPIYSFLTKKIAPVFSSLITCTVIFLVIFVPLVFLVSALSQEAYDLYLVGTDAAVNQDIRELLQNSKVAERVGAILHKYDINLGTEYLNKGLSELGRTVGFFLYQQVSTIASNVFKFVVNFLLMLLVIFFLLIDGKKLIKFLIELSPLPEVQDLELMNKFHAMASVVVVVNGISGLIQGLFGGLVFAVFGLGSPFLWGFIMALLAFFPIVGIGAVFVPTSVYLVLKGRIATGIFFLAFYLVLSSVMEYVIKPKLVGDKVKMHTLLVFLAVLGGLKVFGILGIIYGPLVMTAFLTLTDIYRTSYETYIRNK